MTAPIKALLVYPRFQDGSFWNYQATCDLVGARYPAAPLGLITVAALLPKTWETRLVDRNVEDLEDADLEWADVVMTGGMLPQQRDALAVVAAAKARGIPTVVGGPDATSSPDLYESADIRVLGEAEGIIAAFIAAFEAGERTGVFEAEKFKADVTASPVPRFDLLKLDRYLHVGVQFSRGCPFTCEFCDIIELYGRVPRTKTTPQMLAELEALRDLGYRGHVDFVDDNLIGNKRAVKAFLPSLVAWQEKHHHPFEFSTEASLNLADDPDLLGMMSKAGFFSVFIGIESPDPDVLVLAQKKQNTRRDIAESVHKVYAAGIFVLAGFIVGFDNERRSVAAELIKLVEEAAIPVAMVGLLYALPNTQLTRRLAKEGRLYDDFDVDVDDGSADQCLSGLNFETIRPRAEVLDDYRTVVGTIYTPEAYFGRVARVGRALKISGGLAWIDPKRIWRDTVQFSRLAVALTVKRPDLRWLFWKTLIACLLSNPMASKQVLMMIALYAHLGPFARHVTREIGHKITAEETRAPRTLAAAVGA